jgi:hypothetical protein
MLSSRRCGAKTRSGGFRRRSDVRHLMHELIAQRCRGVRVESHPETIRAIAQPAASFGNGGFNKACSAAFARLPMAVEIRGIEIILPRDADQGEQGVAPCVGSGGKATKPNGYGIADP